MPRDAPLSKKLSGLSRSEGSRKRAWIIPEPLKPRQTLQAKLVPQELSAPSGVSELASLTVASVCDAAATPTPTAETLGVTCTGLLAIYWLLQIVQTLVWPLCALFLGMLALVPGFMTGVLKEIVPTSLRRFCHSLRNLPRSYASIPSCVPATDTQVLLHLPLLPSSSSSPSPSTPSSPPPSTPRSAPPSPPPSPRPTSSTPPEVRLSEASVLLADSYLLLPHQISLPNPFAPDSALPGPSHASTVHWVSSGPIQYTLIPTRTIQPPEASGSTPNFDRAEQSPLPPKNDLQGIVEEEIAEERPLSLATDVSPCAAMFDSVDTSSSATEPVRAVPSETSSARSTLGELKHFDRETKLRPKANTVRSSGTSITLSNFCIPSMNPARLVMYATTAQLLATPCVQSCHSGSEHTLSTIDNDSPIMGYFAPETDSFFFTSTPTCNVGSPPVGNSISDVYFATTGHPSMCFRLPPEEDDLLDSAIDMHTLTNAKDVQIAVADCRPSGSIECLCESSTSVDTVVTTSVETIGSGSFIPVSAASQMSANVRNKK